MIRISRGPEPEALRRRRDYRLPRARLARMDGAAVSDLDISDYDDGKQELYEAQGCKCAFCEDLVGFAGQPVEHFRPKKRAIRADGTAVEGYWWLAWSWDNHQLFACVTCNSGHKRDVFPLEPGASALPELDTDISSERAVMVDPTRDEPLEHIRFLRLAGSWRPAGRTPRGVKTIEILGLDVERIDLYNDHVERFVTKAIGRIRAALQEDDLGVIQAVWADELDTLFALHERYHSLSYWALREAFPADELAAAGLELAAPGSVEAAVPSVDVPHPELEALPEGLRLRVRALGPKPGEGARQEVLQALCAHRPSTVAELAVYLDRDDGKVREDVDALVAAGRLEVVDGVYQVP